MADITTSIIAPTAMVAITATPVPMAVTATTATMAITTTHHTPIPTAITATGRAVMTAAHRAVGIGNTTAMTGTIARITASAATEGRCCRASERRLGAPFSCRSEEHTSELQSL